MVIMSIREVDFLFFNFTRYLVCQFDVDVQWSIKGEVVFFGFAFRNFWILEVVFLESKFQFLTGVILDWIQFCENLAQASLDEFTPAVFW